MTFLKRLWNRQPQAEGGQSELTALDNFTSSAMQTISRRGFMKLLPGIGIVLGLGLPAVTASAEVGIEAFCWDEQVRLDQPAFAVALERVGALADSGALAVESITWRM